ncbi:MAG: response regulator [Thermoanaerobaculia bacterium]
MFLDIEMPKLNGFEVLELLDPSIAAVFVTAYDAWAVKAFEVHAVDYVLKPYPPERIAAAVDRARERLRKKPSLRPEDLAAAARPEGTWLERVVVRDGSRVQIIPVEKLVAAKAEDDYVGLRSEGKTEAADAREPRGIARPEAVRAGAPLAPDPAREPCAPRGLREGQLRRDPD